MLTFLDWNEKFKSKIYPTQSLWHDSFARETEFNLLIYIFNNFWPEFNLPADMHFDRRGTAVLILGPKSLFYSNFKRFSQICRHCNTHFLIAHFSEAENTLVVRRKNSFAFACLNLNKIPAKDPAPKVLNTARSGKLLIWRPE